MSLLNPDEKHELMLDSLWERITDEIQKVEREIVTTNGKELYLMEIYVCIHKYNKAVLNGD